MKNKILTSCICASIILFCGFVGLYIYTLIADPNLNISTSGKWLVKSYPHFSLGNDFKITVTKDGGGNVIFFNQDAPIVGALVVDIGEHTGSEEGWNSLGIDYRIVKDTRRSDSWWTLNFSIWYPIIIFSILPLVFFMRKWRAAMKT
jgi:hypothetical protein